MAASQTTPKSGYQYLLTPIAPVATSGTPAGFTSSAHPSVTTGASQTGTRRFYSDEVGVIFFDTTLGSDYNATTRPTTGTAIGN
jgi:hypothetical protein